MLLVLWFVLACVPHFSFDGWDLRYFSRKREKLLLVSYGIRGKGRMLGKSGLEELRSYDVSSEAPVLCFDCSVAHPYSPEVWAHYEIRSGNA